MAGQQYSLGRIITLATQDALKTPLGSFEIVRVLPVEHGVRQYRIRSLKDKHERVVAEQEIIPDDATETATNRLTVPPSRHSD